MPGKKPFQQLVLLIVLLVSGAQAKSQVISSAPVDRLAVFKGRLWDSMRHHLVYPPDALESGIQGRVIVDFTVRADGIATYFHITRTVHPLLDREALRVVSLLQSWTPAERNGVAVESHFRQIVTFRIEGGGPEEMGGRPLLKSYPEHPIAFTEPIVLNVSLPDSVTSPSRGTIRVNIRWNGDVEVYRDGGALNNELILQAMVKWLDAHPGWKPAKDEYGGNADYVVELPVQIHRL